MKVPVVREGLDITLSKCNVEYNDNECLETVLTLPRQACPSKVSLKHRRKFLEFLFKMTNIKNVYEFVEESGYGVAGGY